jgi:hypothetical protein
VKSYKQGASAWPWQEPFSWHTGMFLGSWQESISKNELALFIGKFSSVFEKQSALFLG